MVGRYRWKLILLTSLPDDVRPQFSQTNEGQFVGQTAVSLLSNHTACHHKALVPP